ncbi:MAG: hypothetical protein U1G07_25130 [Verrucomicrobiota bacterium]
MTATIDRARRRAASKATTSACSVAIAACFLAAACRTPLPQRGGLASTQINQSGHTNAASLIQSDNPKQPSRQRVESEQTIDYLWPAGALLPVEPRTPLRSTNLEPGAAVGPLLQPVPVRIVARDRTDTSIGGAQLDSIRDWASKASGLRPVMWAGIGMMTVVAGLLVYFGWWTKGAAAFGIGLAMVVLAQALPQQGTSVLLGGLVTFALLALLILYVYHKGQLDRSPSKGPSPGAAAEG